MNWNQLGNAAAMSGAQLAGNILTGAINNAMARGNMRLSAQLLQENWNKQFNAQNALNVWMLLNQSQLLKQGLRNAGMSTALMNGQFSSPVTAPNPASPSPNGSAPSILNADLTQALLALKLLDVMDSEALKNTEQSKVYSAEALRITGENKYLDERITAEVNKAVADASKAIADAHLAESNDARVRQDLEYYAEAYPAILRNLGLTGDELEAKIREIDANIDIAYQKLPLELKFLTAQTFEMLTRGELNQAKAKEAFANIAYLNQLRENALLQHQLIDAQWNALVGIAMAEYIGKLQDNHLKIESLKGYELENALKALQNEAYGAVSPSVRGWTEYGKEVINAIGQVIMTVGTGVGIYKFLKPTPTPAVPVKVLPLVISTSTPMSNSTYREINLNMIFHGNAEWLK